jgi:hypothetical protein
MNNVKQIESSYRMADRIMNELECNGISLNPVADLHIARVLQDFAVYDKDFDGTVIRIPYSLDSEVTITKDGAVVFTGIAEELEIMRRVRDAIAHRMEIRNAAISQVAVDKLG